MGATASGVLTSSSNFVDKILKSKPDYDTKRRVNTFTDPITNTPTKYDDPKPIFIITPPNFKPNQNETNPYFGFEWKIRTPQNYMGISIGNAGSFNRSPDLTNTLLYKMEESYRTGAPFQYENKDVSYTFFPNDYHGVGSDTHGQFINNHGDEILVAIRNVVT